MAAEKFNIYQIIDNAPLTILLIGLSLALVNGAACHARGGCLDAAEVCNVLASQSALLDPADMPPPVTVI